MTYDDHPIHSLFALQRPEGNKMILEDLGQPPINYDELKTDLDQLRQKDSNPKMQKDNKKDSGGF